MAKNVTKGRLGNDHKQIIMANLDKSDEELAKMIGRTTNAISKFRAGLPKVVEKMDSEDSVALLHANYFWAPIVKMLEAKEQRFFEQEWIKLHDQFSSQGILHTDEIMMKDLILHEIHANRAAQKKKDYLGEVDDISNEIRKEYNKDINDRDMDYINSLEISRGNLQGAVKSLTQEHLDYQKKKDDKLQQLKATREQRLKQVEMAGKDFWSMIKELNRPDMRRKFGKYMQKHKIAADKIREEWQQSIKYADGVYDSPLLVPEEEDKNET